MSTTSTAPARMQALVATPGGARRIERRGVVVPRPAAEEVLVAVRVFSINRGELALLAAHGEGWRPGQDIAGEVIALGDGVSDLRVGQRVAALVDGGGWAEYAVAPAARIAALPDRVSFEQAAALPMAGTTALNLVRSGGSLLGRRALITGASGGVGGLAVQLLTRSGAHVVALAGSAHAARLRDLGAADVVERLDDRVGTVDVALESVGGQTLAAAIARIAPQGTIVMFGNSSGEQTPIDVFAFVGGHEDARLQTYFSYRHEHTVGANLATLLELVDHGDLRVEIGLHDRWDATEQALAALEQRRVTAKAVLTIE